MLLWFIFVGILIGLFIYAIYQMTKKFSQLKNKLDLKEKSYRDLADQYEAVKIVNQHLENDYKAEKTKYQELEKNYSAVGQLNQKLEEKIQVEAGKSREKDYVLIQQSRLAAMGEMIASMGHQWRQPLNSLSLLVQDVKEAMEYGEIDDDYITRFTSESMLQIKQMSRTINDFQKFYQPSKEKIPFSVEDSIEDALTIFLSNLKNYGIQVEFEYRGQYMAYGFPNEYSQVIHNLLSNSRDAFIQGEQNNRKIRIKLEETTQNITATITDNAGGIEPVLLEKIFDPYFTTRHHGTGLGLYLTKMLVEKMDGNVSVENFGDGARFCLSVPKAAAISKPENHIN